MCSTLNKTEINGHILIPFSGGLESTYLLQKALEEGNNVTLLHLEITTMHSDQKLQGERKACLEILNYFKKKYKDRNIDLHVLNIDSKSHLVKGNMDQTEVFDHKRMLYYKHSKDGTKFIQQPWWLFATALFTEPYHSGVWVGYITGDQSLFYYNEYLKAWSGLNSISKTFYVPLEFPLALYTKSIVLSRLDKKVLNLTWTCEGQGIRKVNGKTRYKACGTCVTCNNMHKVFIDHPEYRDGYWKAKNKSFDPDFWRATNERLKR